MKAYFQTSDVAARWWVQQCKRGYAAEIDRVKGGWRVSHPPFKIRGWVDVA